MNRATLRERLELAQTHGVPITVDDAQLAPAQIRERYAGKTVSELLGKTRNENAEKRSISLPADLWRQLDAEALKTTGGNLSGLIARRLSGKMTNA